MLKVLPNENASRTAKFKQWFLYLSDGNGSGWARIAAFLLGLVMLGFLVSFVVRLRPYPTPIWYWVLAATGFLRLGATANGRQPPPQIGADVSRDRPLKRAWLIAHRWWLAQMSWAHVIILTATAWAVQTTIEGGAPPLTTAAALLLVALAFLLFIRIDWVAYGKNTPNRLRASWQLNGALLIASVSLAVVAYVLITGDSIPFISWMNLAFRLFVGVVLGLTALLSGILGLKYFIIHLLFGDGVDANPTDIVANQNRDRDADFAHIGDTDQALRGWIDYPAEKFED